FKDVMLQDICFYVKDRVSVNDITTNNYISTENLLPEKKGKVSAAKLPNAKTVINCKKGDTLISNIRPYFKKIWFCKSDGGASGDVLVIRAKSNISSSFLYYVLFQDEIFNYMVHTSKGTKMPRGDKHALMKYPIKLPPKDYQIKLANFFSNFDRKIELNNNIISNLEELAKNLFKHWFIDFEFPDQDGNSYKSNGGKMIKSKLGFIPEDWEIKELGDLFGLTKGLSYQSKFLDKVKKRTDSFPMVSLANFDFISGFKRDKTKFYFGPFKEKHIVKPGDIVIAATDVTQDRKILGSPALVPDMDANIIYSLDVFKIVNNTLPNLFLYFILQTDLYRSRVEGFATGTTVL